MGKEKNVRLPGLFFHLGPLFTASVQLMEPEMVHSAVCPLHHMYRSFTHSILWVQLTPGSFLSPKPHLGHRVSDHSKNVLNRSKIQRSSLGMLESPLRNGEECLKKSVWGGCWDAFPHPRQWKWALKRATGTNNYIDSLNYYDSAEWSDGFWVVLSSLTHLMAANRRIQVTGTHVQRCRIEIFPPWIPGGTFLSPLTRVKFFKFQ